MSAAAAAVDGVLVPLAHHTVVVALPFVIPVLAMTAGVVVLALRERRRREREGRTPRV